MKEKIKALCKILIGAIGHLVPIKKGLMLLESHDDFTDNSYAFYEFIKNHHPEIDCVWIISPKNITYAKDHNIKYIVFTNTLKVIWYKYRSEYFIYSYRNFNYFPLKKGQIHINLWHGTPLKRFNGKTISNVDKPDYFFLAPNKFVFEIYERIAPMTDKVIFCGYPRLDYFKKDFSDTQFSLSLKLINVLNHEHHKKVVFMMPTFRFDKRGSQDFFEQFPFPISGGEFEYLNAQLERQDVLLIIKLHHMQNKVDISEFELRYSNIKFLKNIQLVNEGIQLYSLLTHSDALITDYSSVAFDYMMLDKPIGYFINDIENYAKSEGFVFEDPLEYMPGEKFTNIDGLLQFTQNVVDGTDGYRDMRMRISTLMNDENANYSEKLWRKINIIQNIKG